jgi:BirA family transcriptional regulator, biotin operon repressor / biotin---[acetyl-CoA-carboxylase] ligase
MATEGASDGQWLIAGRQTAGRGRLGRAWQSPEGNFYGSNLLRLRSNDPSAAMLAMVTAIALFDAIEPMLPDPAALQIKWPNDVLLNGAKISGILLERVQHTANGDAVVIGIGVNLAHAPDVPGRIVASLAKVGVLISPQEFAPLLADALSGAIATWRQPGGQDTTVRAWLARAHPTGTRLSVNLSDGTVIAGAFDGLNTDGALRLRRVDGSSMIVHAGDVALITDR